MCFSWIVSYLAIKYTPKIKRLNVKNMFGSILGLLKGKRGGKRKPPQKLLYLTPPVAAAATSAPTASMTGTKETTVAAIPLRFASLITSCDTGIPTPSIRMRKITKPTIRPD